MFTVVTMSRGDSQRAEEWVRYHAAIGFQEFRVILDNPCDDTAEVLARVARDVPARIQVEERAPIGDYYDGLTHAERWEAVKAWRVENREMIERSGLPITDPLSWRQYQHFPPVLAEYQARGNGWVCLIDMDEFVVLDSWATIGGLLAAHPGATRLRLSNVNFDTTGINLAEPVLPQCTRRWSWEDVQAHGNGWDKRVKAIVADEAVLPLVSVHAISRGPFVQVATQDARLNHYKVPAMTAIPYSVEDRLALRVSPL